jgi:tRNA A-37 threonylcarbamoyl transferase component Bud32
VPTPSECPECGAPLPPDAPLGVCPKCVLGLMMGGGGDATSDYNSPELDPGTAAREQRTLAALFPQLEILEPIGRGGMGVVYKARQVKLDRPVAIKLIRPESAGDPRFAERFLREARAMARLRHPNIVMIHDFGEVGGLFYLIMELVDGGDLRQALASGPLDDEAALVTAFQVCDALQYAHEQGVIHRDIKPENILRDRNGQVKIADFGLAKLLQASEVAPLTLTRQVMGTPHYMAPEQFERPREADHRADIYSLGVVIYEMFTAGLPLGRYELPSEKVGAEEKLDEIVTTALASNVNERYAKVEDLRDDLIEFAGNYDLTDSWSSIVVRADLLRAIGDGGGAQWGGQSSGGSGWWVVLAVVITFGIGFSGLKDVVSDASDFLKKPTRVQVLMLPKLVLMGAAVVVVAGLVWWIRRKSRAKPLGNIVPAVASSTVTDPHERKPGWPAREPASTKMGSAEAKFLGRVLGLFLIVAFGFVIGVGFLVHAVLVGNELETLFSAVVSLLLAASVLGGILVAFWNRMPKGEQTQVEIEPRFEPAPTADELRTIHARVQGPVRGLLVLASLYLAGGVCGSLYFGYELLRQGYVWAKLTGVTHISMNYGSAILGFAWSLVVVFGGGTMLFAALRALDLKSRGLATIASLLPLVLFPPVGILGLPITIWCLVAFTRPEVVSAFRLVKRGASRKPIGWRDSAIAGVSSQIADAIER